MQKIKVVTVCGSQKAEMVIPASFNKHLKKNYSCYNKLL